MKPLDLYTLETQIQSLQEKNKKLTSSVISKAWLALSDAERDQVAQRAQDEQHVLSQVHLLEGLETAQKESQTEISSKSDSQPKSAKTPARKRTAYLEFVASQDGPLKQKQAKWKTMTDADKAHYQKLADQVNGEAEP